MSDEQNPFAPPQAELQTHSPSTTAGGERSLEDAMAGMWNVSPGDMVRKAWDLTSGAKLTFNLALVIVWVATFGGSMVAGLLVPKDSGQAVQLVGSLLSGFLILPLTAPLQAGLWRLGIRRASGQDISLGELFGFYNQVVPLVLVSIVTALATYIGFLLLIIPGFYLAIASQLALPLVTERGLSPIEAFKTSVKAIGSHWVDVFVLGFLAGLVAMAGFLLVGVGAIWTLPTLFITLGCLYVEVFGWEDKGA